MFCHGAEVGGCEIRGYGDHPLHIVALVLADGGAFCHFSQVAEEDGLAFAVSDWNILGLFEGVHLRLRNLDLNLVGHATVWIGPIVWHNKSAGRSGRHERAGHFGHFDAHESCAFPINGDIHGRIIEGLSELHIAQRRNFLQPLPNFSRELTIGREVRSAYGDFNRSG